MTINLKNLQKVSGDNFAVVLRHDLDELSLSSDLILKTHEKSCLFIMPIQFPEVNDSFVEVMQTRELSLHSVFLNKWVPVFPNGKYHRWLVWQKLIQQVKKLRQKLKVNQAIGHSPHAESNYWTFRPENTWWNIIESTSNVKEISYLSDWILPSLTPHGSNISRHFPTYHKYDMLKIFSTSWDDRSLALPNHHTYLNLSDQNDHWEGILQCINRGMLLKEPVVLSFHPVYFSQDSYYDVYCRVIDYCDDNNIDIVRFSDL